MPTIIDLSGSTALVTGLSQGIGAAIARVLHRVGARVVINHPDSPDGKTRDDAQSLVDAAESRSPRQCAWPGRRRERPRRRASHDGERPPPVGRARHPGEQRGHPPRPLDREDDAGRVARRDRRQSERCLSCCNYGLEIMRDGGRSSAWGVWPPSWASRTVQLRGRQGGRACAVCVRLRVAGRRSGSTRRPGRDRHADVRPDFRNRANQLQHRSPSGAWAGPKKWPPRSFSLLPAPATSPAMSWRSMAASRVDAEGPP